MPSFFLLHHQFYVLHLPLNQSFFYSYAPQHPVIYSAIRETLSNLAERKAAHVYDIAFRAYYNAWRNGPYNQSYMPRWGEMFGGRVLFMDDGAKAEMVADKGGLGWNKEKQIWYDECLLEPIKRMEKYEW